MILDCRRLHQYFAGVIGTPSEAIEAFHLTFLAHLSKDPELDAQGAVKAPPDDRGAQDVRAGSGLRTREARPREMPRLL
jgi:hypothetical protein